MPETAKIAVLIGQQRYLINIHGHPQAWDNGVLMAAWCSGNLLVAINEVALRRTRLLLGWVTVCR